MLHANRNPQNFAQMSMAETKELQIQCPYCISSLAMKTCLHRKESLPYDHASSADHISIKSTPSPRHPTGPIYENELEISVYEEPDDIYVNCFPIEFKEDNVTSVNEAYEVQWEKFKHYLERLTSKREDINNQICLFQKDVKEREEKSLQLAEKVMDVFRGIRWQLEEKEKEVLAKIFQVENHFSKKASDLIRQLENEKKELSRKVRQIEEMLDTADPLTALQGEKSHIEEYLESSYLTIDIREVLPSVLEVPNEGSIFETLHSGLYDIVTGASRKTSIVEASDVFLDVETAANNITISEDLKTASLSVMSQEYPESPERFEDCQVLSSKSFSSGRHYWDVESSQLGDWMIGVAYATIERGGDPSWLGENNQSWCLARLQNNYSVIHAGREDFLPQQCACHRFRIYLDYEAGRLSFYELSKPVRHLYTFKSTFTEPLHAAIGILQDKDWCWVRIKS